jgi:hypothetical protein
MGPESDGANTIYFKQNFRGIEESLSFSLGLFARPGEMNPLLLQLTTGEQTDSLSLPETK